MTHRLRHADADRILARTIGLATALRAAGYTHITRTITADRDGLKATRYDTDTRGGHGGSTVEAAALTDPPITIDRVNAALHQLDQVMTILAAVPVTTPPIQTRRRVGDGPCLARHCEDHWAAGLARKAAEGRYARWCRRCGDHRNAHGTSIPAPVLRALDATREWTVDGREDRQHWTVTRAWDSCGGKPTTPEKA